MKILCRFLSTETFANKASLNKIIICGSFKVILTNLSSYHGPAEIGEFSKSINLNLSFKMNPLLSGRVVHLDVEDCSEELLRQLSYAIKNQLGHPKPPTRGFGTQNTPIGGYFA